MDFPIISGQIIKAQKVVVYGPEGIGKTSFAAQFPKALFIDTEEGSNIYNVARLPKPTSWQMLQAEIKEVAKNPAICDTLVIDTLDRAEQLCVEHVCAIHNKKGIEKFGYGNGYVYVKEEFGRMLNLLIDVINAGVNVVLTAHAQMRKFEQPDEAGSYDRYELKLGKKTSSQTAPLVKEWADMLLFANYKTIVIAQNKEGTKSKAKGGERVMYTTHHPNWDAKNRHDLAEELPFDFKQIAGCIPDLKKKVQEAPKVVEQEQAQSAELIQEEKPISLAQQVANKQKAEAAAKIATTAKVQPTTPKNVETDYKSNLLNNNPMLPKALADLMAVNKVTLAEIQDVVAQKGYYPADTPFDNYASDFIDGCLIGAWPMVLKMVEENREVPF